MLLDGVEGFFFHNRLSQLSHMVKPGPFSVHRIIMLASSRWCIKCVAKIAFYLAYEKRLDTVVHGRRAVAQSRAQLQHGACPRSVQRC